MTDTNTVTLAIHQTLEIVSQLDDGTFLARILKGNGAGSLILIANTTPRKEPKE